MFYHLRPDPSGTSRFNCVEIDNNVGYRCESLLRVGSELEPFLLLFPFCSSPFSSFSALSPPLSLSFPLFFRSAPATGMDVNGRERDNKRAARLNAVERVRVQFVASAIGFRPDAVETSS